MVGLEEFLKELVTTKELLKRLKKDIEEKVRDQNLSEWKRSIEGLSERVESLDKALRAWVDPDELLPKAEKLRKELSLIEGLLGEIQKELEFINENLHAKPRRYSLLLLLVSFLLGLAVGFSIWKLVPLKVSLEGLEYDGRCFKVVKGEVKIGLQNKTFELPSDRIRVEICP